MAVSARDTVGRHGAVVFACALVVVLVSAFWVCDAQPWRWMDSSVNAGLLKISLWVLPSIAVVMWAQRVGVRRALDELRLTSRPLAGAALGLAATIPMGMAALTTGVVPPTTDFLLGAAVIGPFAEEVLFRGLLLQALVRRGRWSAGWAILASALLFGAAHVVGPGDPTLWAWLVVFSARLPGADPGLVVLAQAVPFAFTDVLAPIGQVVMPAIAGLVFGWVAVKTDSLWPAIALHVGLNFWSVLAHGPGNQAQADATSIAQAASLLFAILLAEVSSGRRGERRATSVQRS